MDNIMQWWGYRHTNGSLQAKRWFGDQRDLSEARESDFVSAVTGPFSASSREDALAIIAKRV